MYNIEISELPTRDGRFHALARLDGLILARMDFRDPEHDICHMLTKAGHPDRPVQFWRGTVPTLRHPSMHAMGKRRIGLGEDFPYARPKRSEMNPTIFSKPAQG